MKELMVDKLSIIWPDSTTCMYILCNESLEIFARTLHRHFFRRLNLITRLIDGGCAWAQPARLQTRTADLSIGDQTEYSIRFEQFSNSSDLNGVLARPI
jgi:hypothetical protein